MPTDEEQATGLEKKEHDALVAGVEVCIFSLPVSDSCLKLASMIIEKVLCY